MNRNQISRGFFALVAGGVTILLAASTAAGMPLAQAEPPQIYLPLITNRNVDASLQVLPGSITYFDNYFRRHVVGEVENLGDHPANAIQIDARFYDENDQLIEEGQNGIYLHRLAPRDHTCFDIFVVEPAGFSRFEVSASGYESSGQTYPSLAISNTSSGIDELTGGFTMHGTIQNDEPNELKDIIAVVTLYDGDEQIVDCDYNFALNSTLGPGDSSPIDVNFYSRIATDSYSTVRFLRFQMDANP
jgi:hypothetical protein